MLVGQRTRNSKWSLEYVSIHLSIQMDDFSSVWLQAMDRKQQRLDIILIPVDNFCETFSNSASSPGLSADNSWNNSYCQSISPIQVSWTKIHCHFIFKVYLPSDSFCLKFIFLLIPPVLTLSFI